MTLAVIVSLLVNSIGAFLIASIIVLLAVRVFRLRAGRLRVVLLSLPFAKLLFDVLRGLPETSFLWTNGLTPDNRSVLVGAGVVAPFGLRLQVVMRAYADGREYVLSMGDFVVDACRQASPTYLPLLAAALCLPAALLLARRVVSYSSFARDRIRLRRHADSAEQIASGLRTVDVYQGPSPCSVPFSGGVLRPYVCIPSQVASKLSNSERRAVIEHELAHIRAFDVVLLSCIGVLTDIVWFVPGIRAMARRVAGACELCADDGATNRGVDRLCLASALVRVAEALRVAQPTTPLTAAGRSSQELTRRIHRLLEPMPSAVVSLRHRILRVALGAAALLIVTHTVFISVLGGSY
jgi:BlaR1 peptidase M56